MRYCAFSQSTCPLLNIINIGYAKDTTCFGPALRSYYIIHYVLSGKGYVNGTSVLAGQGFIVKPGTVDHHQSSHKEPWELLWIVSDDPAIGPLLERYNAHPQTGIFSYGCMDAVRELSLFLKNDKKPLHDGFEMLELFLKVFNHQHLKSPMMPDRSNADMYLDAAETYINSHIDQPLTVSELTDFLGVSQPYLFTIFKKKFQQSPKQYILDKKLALARILLKETELSITDIAHSVGVQDVLSFSKSFRSKMGMSPARYRESSTTL